MTRARAHEAERPGCDGNLLIGLMVAIPPSLALWVLIFAVVGW